MILYCHHYFAVFLTLMASRAQWTQEALLSALDDISHKKLSYRSAETKYGIPKSTLALYVTGKLEVGSKPGPDSVPTTAEESKLVEYVLHESYWLW